MGFYFMRTKTKIKATQKQDTVHHSCRHRCHHIFLRTFTFLTLFFSMMLQEGGVQANIVVNDYGVKKVKDGDTAMVFYANASHSGNEGDSKITARLHMEECCLLLPPGEKKDCETMKLISGLGIVFHPKDTHILHMYFVNFDLYDREGSCVLRILSREIWKHPSPSFDSTDPQNTWDHGSELTIPFKNVLPKPSLLGKLFSGSPKGYRVCNKDNYNALHECSDYDDCLIRYAGGRSLFNKTSKECEPTPNCEDNDINFLSIVTRKCEKGHDIDLVRKSFTADMTFVNPTIFSDALPTSDHPHHLSSLMIIKRNASTASDIISNVVCEHGVHFTNKNGKPDCTCSPGWTSLTIQEWKDKAGVMPSSEEGLPFHHMCTVPLISQKTRGIMVLVFLLVCLIVPFTVMLMINQGKKKKKLDRRDSSVQKILGEESTSTSEDEDEETGKHIKRNKSSHKAAKSTQSSLKSVNEMEEEDADQVISEITNRREPQLLKKPSKDDGNNDDPPQQLLPPAPSSSQEIISRIRSNVSSQASQEQQKDGSSKSNWSIPWHPSQQPSQQSMPPSSTQSTSTTTAQPPPSYNTRPSSKHGSGNVSTINKITYTTSGGFDYAYSDQEVDDRKLPEVNMNVVATQTQSTDDLLTMNKQEKWGAHVPMSPKSTEDKGVSVMVAECAIVELKENGVILHSLSSEEITQRKKEEWAQFIKTVSQENLQLRPSSRSISLEGRSLERMVEKKEEDDDDDDEEVVQYTRDKASQYMDFSYFNKDHKPKAIKVRSVPGMMQYHPFTSSSTPSRQHLPEPPPQFIQKAFGEMQPEELASRQECYQILRSLSSQRVSSQEEGNLKSINSIWSNIASENTKELSTTPATTTEGSRLVSSCEDGVGHVDCSTILRTNPIYGNVESDLDSDEALEELAGTSLASSSSGPPNQGQTAIECCSEGRNRTVYGIPPLTTTAALSTIRRANNNEGLNVAARLTLESDNIPSDAYITDSMESLRIDGPSMSTTEFWKAVTAASIGGNERDGNGTGRNTVAVVGTGSEEWSAETTSAYRIKSSLEIALKASKSRSGTNLF